MTGVFSLSRATGFGEGKLNAKLGAGTTNTVFNHIRATSVIALIPCCIAPCSSQRWNWCLEDRRTAAWEIASFIYKLAQTCTQIRPWIHTIYIYIYIRVGWKVHRLIKILSWNVIKWSLFFKILLFCDPHTFFYWCCSAWMPLVKKSSIAGMMSDYKLFSPPSYIYIYIYILSSTDRSVSFYQNSSVWLDGLDSQSWDRNQDSTTQPAPAPAKSI